ncbi:MAG: 16S rRNA (guanine(966)-N(2))-methyltransferase RsmD [Candidatus Parcubacteria bacterium]|nr:16S rRNA (guanine(966)-N(2))-methyltransferase RsmD [Burkholderiales bacterium]
MRLIGGKYRSRLLRVPARPGLRPTPDRVRETLFNWLGQDLTGLDCLDLYAGSGALGFEAASRGAARVVLVDNDKTALAELERSRQALDAKQVVIVRGEAAAFLAREAGRFDVVFLDPPFRQNAVPEILDSVAKRLKPDARVYVESEAAIEPETPWTELRRARAGQVSYQLFRWDGSEEGP